MTKLNYSRANNIEKILRDIEDIVRGLENWFVYSGVSRSGQNRLWQNKFRHFYKEQLEPIELSYLESTGSKWIDTGVRPNPNTRVVMDFKIVQVGSQNGFFGVKSDNGFNYNAYNNSTNKIGFSYQDNTANSINTGRTIADNDVVSLDMDGVRKTFKTTINGSSITFSLSSYTATQTSDNNLYLFAYNFDGAVTQATTSKIQLYACKIYDNGVLIRDYIPVVDYLNVPCLYDKIGNDFFYLQEIQVGEYQLMTEMGNGITTESGEAIDFESVPYTMLDWIESTGTQYINTGIVNSATIKIECKLSGDGRDSLCGSEYTWNGQRFKFGISGNARTPYYGYGTSNNFATATTGINTPYTFYISRGNQWIKDNSGTTIKSSTDTSLTQYSTIPILLFSMYETNEYQVAPLMRIYYCKIWNGDALVRDFIPALDENNVACLYDKVTETCFYNQGTGNFVPSETTTYKTLDYLESTGTQYINTGIKTNEISRARGIATNTFGLVYNQTHYGGSLFGARVSTTNSVYQYGTGANNDFIGNGTSQITLTKNTQTIATQINYSKTNYNIDCGSYTATGNLNVTISTPLDFYVCGMNNNGSFTAGTFKVMAVQLENSNNEVFMQLIPCIRKSDNVPCFYDLVSNTFYTNAGTGTFLYG